MPATYTTLRLSTTDVLGNVVTINLLDGTSFALQEDGWAPGASQLSENVLERGPYTLVEDVLSIDAFGSSALTNVGLLDRLFEQARRFAKGEGVAAVLFECQLLGSNLGMLTTVVLDGTVDRPSNFNDLLMVNEIAGVELHLMHRQWLGASEAVSSPAAAIATTTVTNVSWTSTLTPVVGVLSLQLTGFNSSTMSIQPIPGGYLLGASNQAPGGVLPLQVIEAETLATGAFTSVADSTNLARGGSVLRYTPTGTAQIVANEVALSSPGLAQAQMINVFACVRNNTAGKRYLVNYYTRTRSRQVWSTPVVVELATNTPTIIPLGMVASRNGHALFDLAVQAIDTGGTLDIDYIAIQNVDDPGAYVAQWGVTSTTTYAASTALALAIEDRSLTELNPTVAMVNTSGTADYTYIDQYTSMYLPTVGNVAYLLLLMPYSNYWRVPNGVAAAQIGFSASRRPVYLSPQ